MSNKKSRILKSGTYKIAKLDEDFERWGINEEMAEKIWDGMTSSEREEILEEEEYYTGYQKDTWDKLSETLSGRLIQEGLVKRWIGKGKLKQTFHIPESKYPKDVIIKAKEFIKYANKTIPIDSKSYEKIIDLINDNKNGGIFWGEDFDFLGVKHIKDSRKRWNIFLKEIFSKDELDVLWGEWFYYDLREEIRERTYFKINGHIINEINKEDIKTIDLGIDIYREIVYFASDEYEKLFHDTRH
jgi:hypothetical protein